MNILFINQFFWPDSSASSQQLTDLATGLAARGHRVTVLCSAGGYANAAQAETPRGVHIVRVPVLPYARGKAARVLSYLSFYSNAALRALAQPRPDVVVTLTTPPLISLVGVLLQALRGARHFTYEQDMYPDVAVDLNQFRRGGLADRVVGTLADFARRRASGVIALGQCTRTRLLQRGIPADKIHVAENWASSQLIHPLPRPGSSRELVLLYSGNLGLAHDLDTLTGTMLQLRADARFRFLFVGSGGRRAELEAFATQHALTSVELRPYVPRDQLSEGLALGDIGLVTQHNVCVGSVVPSKAYGIMAAARPILFIGPAAATPALLIARHQCGWRIEPGDTQALTDLLLHLAANPQLVRESGQRARQALVANYDLSHGIAHFAKAIETTPQPVPVPAILVNS